VWRSSASSGTSRLSITGQATAAQHAIRDFGASASSTAASRFKPMRRFELTDAEHKILASWRADVGPSHWPGNRSPIEAPTSVELERDLRRFEERGDP
jgi:hypothetical protein